MSKHSGQRIIRDIRSAADWWRPVTAAVPAGCGPDGKFCRLHDGRTQPLTQRRIEPRLPQGHWIHKGAIVQFNNHEGIIPLNLFMYAYTSAMS